MTTARKGPNPVAVVGIHYTAADGLTKLALQCLGGIGAASAR